MTSMAIAVNESRPELSAEPSPPSFRVCEVIAALSRALDLTEGQPMGHSVRSCLIGMRLAEEIGLSREMRGNLYYALLMKDAGCSSNASRMVQILGTDDIQAKRDVKTTDWTRIGWESLQYALSHVSPGAPFLERVRALFSVAVHQKKNAKQMVQIRCERGASIARRIGLSESAATSILSLDEHWNGCGQPMGLHGEEIPLFSRIMNLAQTLEIFHATFGANAALDMARKRSGRWFDPKLVRALGSLATRSRLWREPGEADNLVLELAPGNGATELSDAALDNICAAFSDVIDAKSPFTYRHSAGVAGAAVSIAQTLGLPAAQVTLIRRAALLHDIGKLGVSNAILDKPGKLTDDEWVIVRKHPYYSYEILKRIPGFGELCEIAASHHEKLDGSGYYRQLTAPQMSLPARILVVSDIYDALAAKRPYRDALPVETVFGIMQKDVPHALDATCFEALQCSFHSGNRMAEDLMRMVANIEPNTSLCVSSFI